MENNVIKGKFNNEKECPNCGHLFSVRELTQTNFGIFRYDTSGKTYCVFCDPMKIKAPDFINLIDQELK